MSTNTRLVLQMTAILLIGGMILIWIGEVRNPLTLGNLSFGDQLVLVSLDQPAPGQPVMQRSLIRTRLPLRNSFI